MAALNSSRIYDLVDRYLFRARDNPSSTYENVQPKFTAVRELADLFSAALAEVDDEWLGRSELRGPAGVIEYLEAAGFRKARSASWALLVDERCGLICSLALGTDDSARSTESVSKILRRAAECQAAGMVLATNDDDGTVGRSLKARDFTIALFSKGDAIGLYLLDHFVLVEGQWKRMMSINPADQI